MDIYLAIITTVLVATQIVRLIQNAIQLHRQEKQIERQLSWLKDRDITERDFDVQRDCYYLLRDYLEREMNIDYGACEEYYEGSEDG
jgi:phosphate uptake regulator